MNYWQTLEIDRDSDLPTIKKAYAKKLKTLDLSKQKEEFIQLRSAYEAALNYVKQQSDQTTIPSTNQRKKLSTPDNNALWSISHTVTPTNFIETVAEPSLNQSDLTLLAKGLFNELNYSDLPYALMEQHFLSTVLQLEKSPVSDLTEGFGESLLACFNNAHYLNTVFIQVLYNYCLSKESECIIDHEQFTAIKKLITAIEFCNLLYLNANSKKGRLSTIAKLIKQPLATSQECAILLKRKYKIIAYFVLNKLLELDKRIVRQYFNYPIVLSCFSLLKSKRKFLPWLAKKYTYTNGNIVYSKSSKIVYIFWILLILSALGHLSNQAEDYSTSNHYYPDADPFAEIKREKALAQQLGPMSQKDLENLSDNLN